ncbi:MAG: 50S ribosomal protein L9 [Candidatus Tectomicrobia bacterium]|uniref:Large ribosomal subunit protein bL9 n=1 Tax=Tectimicrobiota bacterium TaxID=2528274 RepID=A0A932G154_UNCTE|nr:50S ribosomal protein L9 [Candidatus Tectomicrobia bacterium]
MKIILKEEVLNLGQPGQIVEVAAGYARNYLLPRGLALSATPQNLKLLEQQRKTLDARLERSRQEATAMARRLEAVTCTIPVRVGEQNRIFGSITSQDIVDCLEQQGIQLDRRRIQLDSPLRSLGSHGVFVRLHPEVKAELKVEIVPQARPVVEEPAEG